MGGGGTSTAWYLGLLLLLPRTRCSSQTTRVISIKGLISIVSSFIRLMRALNTGLLSSGSMVTVMESLNMTTSHGIGLSSVDVEMDYTHVTHRQT